MTAIDEALKIIRDTWPSNPDYLDDLKERLTGEHPIPLLPFIGAGLAVPMGFPAWAAFLTAQAAECGLSPEVAALLASDRYEDAAEMLLEGRAEIFHRRVTHIFGKRKSDACELRGAVLALPDLVAGPVVTTNFDQILERVFAEARSPFERVVWGSQVDSIRRAVTENRHFLLKIHGDGEERTGRVLTRGEYDKHYASGDPDGLRAQLGRIFQGRTVLFIGCSLATDRTMDVLSEALRQTPGLAHFAIVEKPSADDKFFARQRSLEARGIMPLWYPATRHDLIEPLLRWIASLQPARPVQGPELVLERPAQRKLEIRSELDLLIPYQRTTAFRGREADLESLRAWLATEPPVSVRVVTGGGGSGKTRLAVELIEWLEAAQPGQWNCGFLTPLEMDRFSGLQNLSQWRRRQPVLAVLDYAAGSAERLRAWLEQLVVAASGGEKLRLLLLEREATRDGGWLASALSHGSLATGVQALLDPPQPLRLQTVAGAADRRVLLRETVAAGAAYRNVKAPDVPAIGADAWFDRRLDEAPWGDPLTLMMAGLTALDTGVATALALGRQDLASRLAERECARIVRFGNGAPARLMEHLAAYVTVSGGLSREKLPQAAKVESEATGRLHPAGWRELADCVGEALSGGEGVKAVEPDIVGEALLLRVWGGAEAAEGTSAVVRASQARAAQVAAAVIRTAQDFCVSEQPRREPLQWLDALIAAARDDFTLLSQISGALPLHTLVLRERAVKVDALLAVALQQRLDSDPASAPQLAHVLDSLGMRLGDLGRREEALEAASSAVGLYWHLANQRNDSDLSLHLAMALDHLANRLGGVGRHEEALQVSSESVRIFRQVADLLPGVPLPELALSVGNRGSRLSALARHEEALEASEEAVALYRRLAAGRPDEFLPDLATMLSNRGGILTELGRREEALQSTAESVSINRLLTSQHPDAFLPALVSSLNNLGNKLSDVGRREEGLEATQEAVRIRRQLAAQRPDVFLDDLAMSLNNLSITLSDLGRRQEALEVSQEAAGFCRQLVRQNGDVSLPGLAIVLANLSDRLSDLGQTEDALRTADEAVALHRRLVILRPDAHLPDLAMSLTNFADRLNDVQRSQEALQATGEAVSLYRQLFGQRPDFFRYDLARTLGAKGAALRQLEDGAGAAASFHEAIECLEPLFLRYVERFRPLMTYLAYSYFQICQSAGLQQDPRLIEHLAPLLFEIRVEGAGS